MVRHSQGFPDGPFDYRNAAVQIRYRINEKDQLVVQFLNRRLGTGPLQQALPDVALQWGYWQRRADWGTLKIGRAPMPRGIFNETRFVGTVLPFFRPSFEIYGEGRETVDGAVYTRDFRADNGVGLQVNAFIGSNEVRTQVITTAGNSIRAFRGSVLKGGQLWLSIPQGETRVSGYFAHYRNDQPTTFGKRHEMLASIESHPLPRTTLRAEGLRIYGYGLTYRIGGGALVRLERHEVTGYAFDAPVPFLATTGANSVVAPGSYGAYWLASFAVSF